MSTRLAFVALCALACGGSATVRSQTPPDGLVAQQVADIWSLAPGRLTLGIGPSHGPQVEGRFGLKYPVAAVIGGAALYRLVMPPAALHVVAGGDHSFTVARAGTAGQQRVQDEVRQACAQWMRGIMRAGC